MLPIIDTHQHLWDLTRFQLPWLSGAPALNRSFVLADYAAATAGSNVVQTVYMEVDVAPEQQVDEAEMLIQLCADPATVTAGAVISGRPADPDFVAYMAQFQDQPAIKGVRQVLHVPETPRGYCLSADFLAGVRHLGQLGRSFDICLRPSELADAVKLAKACPETRFVLDHCGNADPNIVNGSARPAARDPFAHTGEQWMDDMADLGQLENVICKISGIVARTQPGWKPADLAPTVNHCLDAFGPDRVVFGGDWPVCTLGASFKEWADALRAIISHRSEEAQRKLLHDNAAAFYGLA